MAPSSETSGTHEAGQLYHLPCVGLSTAGDWCSPQPCALSTQGPVAVPLHLSPAELALVCSPQTDTAACATRATRCTPAISAASVCQHRLRGEGRAGQAGPGQPWGGGLLLGPAPPALMLRAGWKSRASLTGVSRPFGPSGSWGRLSGISAEPCPPGAPWGWWGAAGAAGADSLSSFLA